MIRHLLLLLCFVALVSGDCYMQNPRGSNNRLNGNNRNVNNDDRLFDSQNNNAGGYCYGPPLHFYEGSELTVEWTAQHSCGQDKAECQIIMQYMCTDREKDGFNVVRDGATTNTIPEDPTQANEMTEGIYVYGMHEPLSYYQGCRTRERNKGLFIADRTLNGNTARFTRQNNNGARDGFECPEERDYYPYWHPTPWKDIIVFTHDTDMCDYYEMESQNVKDKGHCMNDVDPMTPNAANSKSACDQQDGTVWLVDGAWGIDAPECEKAPWSRDNHLGNGGINTETNPDIGGFTNHYNWSIPDSSVEKCILTDSCDCVLRIRYNISTKDTDNWGVGLNEDGDFDFGTPDSFMDLKFNGEDSPVKQDQIVEYMTEKPLELALNTNQYGRVFQDRSHTFSIKARPSGLITGNIYNLNVRGKRGNIVQTYPATEYDFVPQQLEVKINDYVHFQWTGCDNNPNGNAGEGREQTDRSNIVQIKTLNHNYPVTEKDWEAGLDSDLEPLFEQQELRAYFAYLGQTACKTRAQLLQDNNNENDIEDDVNNCAKLNAAPRYFDGGLIKMNSTGSFAYMSTRNNNFTNRSQKGVITVFATLRTEYAIIVTIAVVAGVAIFGVLGAFFFAKAHPHSKIAEFIPRSML